MPVVKLDRQRRRMVAALYASGKWTQVELARRYGVTQGRVSQIISSTRTVTHRP